MGYGPHGITAHGNWRDVSVVPRFSVYLEQRAQERVERAAEESSRVSGCDRDRNGDGDVFEAGAYVRAEREARERQGAPGVETVERVRVQMTSPAGRFLDLLI